MSAKGVASDEGLMHHFVAFLVSLQIHCLQRTCVLFGHSDLKVTFIQESSPFPKYLCALSHAPNLHCCIHVLCTHVDTVEPLGPDHQDILISGIHACVCVCTFGCVSMCVNMCVCVHIWVCKHVCEHVCVCAHMSV